jgi:hypothetical protein
VPPLPSPFPWVGVLVVVVVVVVSVAVVVGVVVGGAVVELVVVVVLVGAGGGVVVVVGAVTEGVVALPSSPVSDAITTTATINPITAATRTASAHLTPRLIPPPGG